MRKFVIAATVMLALIMATVLLLPQVTTAAPNQVDGGIHGMKFHDLNGNGERDAGEPGIPGWKIIIEGEDIHLETFTDDDGLYWFMNLPGGDYVVVEEDRPGWVRTHPVNGSYSFLYDPAQAIDGLDFGNRMATDGIHGMKFLDRDGDGIRDNDEPGIPGWIIILEGEGLTRATETNEEGAYWFTGLMTGTYTISETLRPGWQQTAPANGSYTLSYVPSQPIERLDFGNRPDLGEIHGVKFHDLNGNGVRETNEPGLEGWHIKLLNADNQTVGTATTDADGMYWFMDLEPGPYRLMEELQQGWHQTFPQGGFHHIMLMPNQVIEHAHFGNWQPDPGEIHGTKFDDKNGNGVRDTNEPGLEGWTIILEREYGNLRLETTTGPNGEYWFMELPPGTYHVAEKQQDDWRQTFPKEPRYHEIELAPGTIVEGIDFGNWKPGPGSIHGVKFNDLNGNGRRDPNEPGLAGWKIMLEGNGAQAMEETDENGRYWFMDLAPGLYRVKEVQQDGWRQTLPPNQGHHTVELRPGDEIHGVNFGNWKPGPGEIHGRKFNDLNGNGKLDDNEPPIEGWTITLLKADGQVVETTQTNPNGVFWFMGLPPGQYIVMEEQQAGWQQTFPPHPGKYNIYLEAGEINDDLLFGNWRPGPGSIHGMKFHDLDGDGQKDPNEPGLPGWTIVLEGVDGNVHSETVTDADGKYWFMDLHPGKYHVGERIPPGSMQVWHQTHPPDGFHTVELGPNQTVEDVDFGNWKPTPGSIHGMKFFDRNGNGQKDPNEPGLPGWTIVLESEDGLRLETVTGDDGEYWFMPLRPGEYHIIEKQQDGWQQTHPADPRFHKVLLGAGDVKEDVDFGNWKPEPGSIHGTKFFDENGNGQQDPGEPGLSGWIIILRGKHGVWRAETDDNGNYWFEEVLPGTYRLHERFRWGWRQTFPKNPAAHEVTVGPGQVVEGLDFGNRLRRDHDFCKMHWDIHFEDEDTPVLTRVRIFNTSSSAQTYHVEMVGLPEGTDGSNADGPAPEDFNPVSATLNIPALSKDKLPVSIDYPQSFKDGKPGPAFYEAVVTNVASGETFGCRAALWPVRDVQARPQNDEIQMVGLNAPQMVNFIVNNTGTTLRAPAATIDYTIYAMTDGEEDDFSSNVKLNGLPEGNIVNGQLTIPAGLSTTLSVNVEFSKLISNTTSDIVLEVDLDGDGQPDLVTSSLVQGEGPIVYLPIVRR